MSVWAFWFYLNVPYIDDETGTGYVALCNYIVRYVALVLMAVEPPVGLTSIPQYTSSLFYFVVYVSFHPFDSCQQVIHENATSDGDMLKLVINGG